MIRSPSILLAGVLLIVVESSAKFIHPTYKPPPPTVPTYRFRREVDDPQWLWKGDDVQRAPATGDHPHLPAYIDDVTPNPNTRYARSLDSPSAKRGGGSHSTSGGSRDTGPTHPGSNRRNARSLHIPPTHPLHYPPPSPTFPRPPNPFNPSLGGKPTLIARAKRDIQFPQKPKHHDIVIPGWNPNARVNSWQKIRVKA